MGYPTLFFNPRRASQRGKIIKLLYFVILIPQCPLLTHKAILGDIAGKRKRSFYETTW